MRIELVLAPNPGPMTGPGTNCWVVSSGGEAVVIDPGPDEPAHREAIVDASTGLTVAAVLVTHLHPDHTPLANPLGVLLGAPVMGAASGPGFDPDRTLADGDRVEFGDRSLEVIATPGHTPDSLSYRVDDRLFTGDHIMGGSTVIVEDMAQYMESLRKVLGIGVEAIHPGHGPVLDRPDDVVAEYLAHRLERERQVLEAVRSGAGSVGAVVERVYADVDRGLHAAAAISVEAHLRKLAGDALVRFHGAGWHAPVEPVP
ncbi:MAG: MBL fold metallo-hydrolase [Acidimicrobiia bacterium]|nr:MAG: MBL fold metallo-hydrolase [Acidimicrobiia bacterium]